MDSEDENLVLNRSKHKRKLIVSSDDDQQEKKIKQENNVEPKKEQEQEYKQEKEKEKEQEKEKEKEKEQKIKTKEKTVPPNETISTPKNNIVYDILKRWWYCLDDWPPVDYDYDAQLHSRGYRQVLQEQWRQQPEVDYRGLYKVYPVQGYLGLFRDAHGQLVDVRPQDSCPSFDNLKQKSLRQLFFLLVKAYENQIKEYSSLDIEEQDSKYLSYLQSQLKKTQYQQKSLLQKIESIKRINDAQAS